MHFLRFFSLLVLSSSWLSVLADVEVDSIHIVFHSCDTEQKRIINDAWDDMNKLAKWTSDNLNFEESVALEFWGPRVTALQEYKDRIASVFSNIKTYDRGTFSPFNWNFNVVCALPDDDTCGRTGVGAYTKNIDSAGKDIPGNPKSTPYIILCKPFFSAERLDKIIEYTVGQDLLQQRDLRSYRNNGGYFLLHEIIHCDAVTYTRNGNVHASDYHMKLYNYNCPHSKRCMKNVTEAAVYGALFTKIMARMNDFNTPAWVTANADNWAQFALGKYVTSKIGFYPAFPVADKFGQGTPQPNSYAIMETVDGQWGVDTESLDAVQSELINFPPPQDDVVDIGGPFPLIPDSAYPQSYLNDVRTWSEDNSPSYYWFRGSPPVSRPAEDFSFTCASDNSLISPGQSVNRTFAADSVANACSIFNNIVLDGNTQKQLSLPYVIPSQGSSSTTNDLWIGAFYNLNGDGCTGSTTLTTATCTDHLLNILDACDTSSVTQKYGGSKVSDCVVYRLGIQSV